MLIIDQIRALHIELTTNCNARCPMCMRNYRGYEFNSGYPFAELRLEHIKKIFSQKFLQQIKYINFNGNLGDFGMAKDALDIVRYFLDYSTAQIQIETNGSMRTQQWWSQLAHSRVKILWALDGLSDTHKLYRQDTDWQKIIDNAGAFISNGGNAVWKFITFDHNRHQLEQCRMLSQQLGFKGFVIYDQGRDKGPVFDRKGDFSHWLGPPQDQQPNITDMVQNHLTWFDPKMPIPWIKNQSAPIDCKHLKKQEIYVAADGSVYPCCWLGYFPATMSHPGNQQIQSLISNNNALEHSLEECLSWFNRVEQSWKFNSIAQGRLYACVSNCSASRFVV